MHAALCAPDVISHSPPDETVDEAPPAGAGASADRSSSSSGSLLVVEREFWETDPRTGHRSTGVIPATTGERIMDLEESAASAVSHEAEEPAAEPRSDGDPSALEVQRKQRQEPFLPPSRGWITRRDRDVSMEDPGTESEEWSTRGLPTSDPQHCEHTQQHEETDLVEHR